MAHVHRQAACVIKEGRCNKGTLDNYLRSPGDAVTGAFPKSISYIMKVAIKMNENGEEGIKLNK